MSDPNRNCGNFMQFLTRVWARACECAFHLVVVFFCCLFFFANKHIKTKFKLNSIEVRQFPMPIQQMPPINTVVCIIATHLINSLIKSESYEHGHEHAWFIFIDCLCVFGCFFFLFLLLNPFQFQYRLMLDFICNERIGKNESWLFQIWSIII